MLVVEADAGTTTRLALVAPRAVLAKAGTTTRLALVAPRAMLAKAGAIASASRVMFTEAGAAVPLAVWARISNAPHDWVRCRGFRRRYRSCWGCLIHGVVAASCREFSLFAF